MDQNNQNAFIGQQSADNLVNAIFLEALKQRVSDMHFEPGEDFFTVRFRIDGLLHPAQKMDKKQQEEIVSRIKILSSLNITEHRLPQDGYLEYVSGDRTYNIRVSTLPTLFGEAIVCRIHNREDTLLNLKDLGFDNTQLEEMIKLIASESGIILATGPTGSGKTNLLYSILHILDNPDRNILTVEDPIEYHLPHMRQTQINEANGLTFGKVMRSIVRQDPDVVMLGEIRDAETAQMAAQLSLIGTRVFSTFHTFDMPGLIVRFKELGIPNSIIAQAIKGVISARLLRKICTSCKTAYQPTNEEKLFLGTQGASVTTLYKGTGCENCKQLGYIGRTGVYEIIIVDEDLRASIMEEKPAVFINDLLRQKNVKTLRQSAIQKIIEGITTIGEMLRVLGIPSANLLVKYGKSRNI
ncbi:MAG TPA: GspE/PulE family protein [Methylomirabilota bacterium]|nr:GspE/PulE family protein [Methylomirabilota bacterium]